MKIEIIGADDETRAAVAKVIAGGPRPLAERLPEPGQVIISAEQSATRRQVETEAMEVARKTGRTPRQLVEERAELIASLAEAVAYIKAGCPDLEDTDETIATAIDDGPEAVFHYSTARELLTRLQP